MFGFHCEHIKTHVELLISERSSYYSINDQKEPNFLDNLNVKIILQKLTYLFFWVVYKLEQEINHERNIIIYQVSINLCNWESV